MRNGIKTCHLVSLLYQNEVTGHVMLGIVQLLIRIRQRCQSDASLSRTCKWPPQSGHAASRTTIDSGNSRKGLANVLPALRRRPKSGVALERLVNARGKCVQLSRTVKNRLKWLCLHRNSSVQEQAAFEGRLSAGTTVRRNNGGEW